MTNQATNIIVSAFISAVVPFANMSTSLPASIVSAHQNTIQEASPTPTMVKKDTLIWVVKPGDTVKSIAYLYYGDEAYWTTVWNDNPWITDPNSLPKDAVMYVRKEKQTSPDSLNPQISLQLQNPRTLEDGERYAYIMNHTTNFGGLVWSMPLLTYKYISTQYSYSHPGIDMTTYTGVPTYAATDGTVLEAGWSNVGYGNTVLLAHANGYFTRYAHLSSIKVSKGQYVSRGALLGGAGCTGRCTGTHLHFELHSSNGTITPYNIIKLW